MKNILLPTDFSEAAETAFIFANKIAKKINAEIHALKVISAPLDADFDSEGNIIDNSDFDLSTLYRRLEENKTIIKHWTKEHAKVKIHHHVKIGHLHEDILGFADKLQIDFIIMGTKGTDNIEEFMAGSNTEYIVRKAKVPVLSIKQEKEIPDFKNILLVSDFNQPREEPLEVLKEIQKISNAQLHLLKIDKTKNQKKEEKTREKMEEFVQINQLEDISYHLQEETQVERGVLHFAEETDMDLIVVGTHGRTGLAHFLFGSIAEDMVNHINKPILTFKLS